MEKEFKELVESAFPGKPVIQAIEHSVLDKRQMYCIGCYKEKWSGQGENVY